jgi:hypothetical protein
VVEGEAGRAIIEWLTVSGRLAEMREGKYIFTPIRYREREETGREAEDWLEDKPIGEKSLGRGLKVYARRLHIDENKLTWNALRNTAIRLRLEAGESAEGMRTFMQSRASMRKIRRRMKQFPPLAPDDVNALREAELPERHGHPFKPRQGIRHGVYSRYIDPQAVKAVMQEDPRGMEQEVQVLQNLMQGLLERGVSDGIIQAYAMAAGRLAELMRRSKAGSESKEQKQDEEFLAEIDKRAALYPGWPTGAQFRSWAAEWDEGGLTAGRREMEATVRLMLRQVEKRSFECSDDAEYVHLVDLYGQLCMRLAKIVNLGRGQPGQLMRFRDAMLTEAIRRVRKEMGLKE